LRLCLTHKLKSSLTKTELTFERSMCDTGMLTILGRARLRRAASDWDDHPSGHPNFRTETQFGKSGQTRTTIRAHCSRAHRNEGETTG
jgi:hypothetical protein